MYWKVQLVEKDGEKAIELFNEAIRAGDKVGSALKDMAVVMKQLDRAEEAIEAIKSFRTLCSTQSQHSLDNLLIDLYKVSYPYIHTYLPPHLVNYIHYSACY